PPAGANAANRRWPRASVPDGPAADRPADSGTYPAGATVVACVLARAAKPAGNNEADGGNAATAPAPAQTSPANPSTTRQTANAATTVHRAAPSAGEQTRLRAEPMLPPPRRGTRRALPAGSGASAPLRTGQRLEMIHRQQPRQRAKLGPSLSARRWECVPTAASPI